MKSRKLIQILGFAEQHTKFDVEIRILASSLTATEMQFRPLTHRFVEYLATFFLLCMGRDIRSFTIGISQVSIRHVMEKRKLTQFQSYRYLLSAKNNLEICCLLVEEAQTKDLGEIQKMYNGTATWFYQKTLERYVKEITALHNLKHKN